MIEAIFLSILGGVDIAKYMMFVFKIQCLFMSLVRK